MKWELKLTLEVNAQDDLNYAVASALMLKLREYDAGLAVKPEGVSAATWAAWQRMQHNLEELIKQIPQQRGWGLDLRRRV